MPEIKQDLLGLQYSQPFAVEGMQEADINLSLSPAAGSFATLYGQVTDGTVPVLGATVKIFDDKGVPFKHTMTDDNGEYTMDGIPAGTYTVAAVKQGYRLSPAVGVTLAVGDTTEVALVCALDATLALGAIAGVVQVMEGSMAVPLSGAKVTLKNSGDTAIASTYTAKDGEFAFYDVADGVYTLLATADGYLPSAPMIATITGGSIANIIMTMVVDTRTYNGTVSGVIRDQSGNAVVGCFVGLFAVSAGEERLVATTKTNTEGKYLFGGVGSGQYMVKAKKSQ